MMFTRAARSVTAEASSDALSEGGSEVGAEIGVAFNGVAGAGSGVGFGAGGITFFGTGIIGVCAEVVATVFTTASVDDAFWIVVVGMRGMLALPNTETTKIPMKKIVAMPMWGLKRFMCIRYYQAGRDTNICLHMLVRGKRREEGRNVLIAKMVFSHHSGTSLMVEQKVSNLLVGVRFSRPAQPCVLY